MARPLQPIKHGTRSGYEAHRRRGIPIDGCGCQEATAARMRELRKDPEQKKKHYTINAARAAALVRLGRLHPEEYQLLYAEELVQRHDRNHFSETAT